MPEKTRDELISEWAALNEKKCAVNVRIQGYLNATSKEGEAYREEKQALLTELAKQQTGLAEQIERVAHAIGDVNRAAETDLLLAKMRAAFPHISNPGEFALVRLPKT